MGCDCNIYIYIYSDVSRKYSQKCILKRKKRKRYSHFRVILFFFVVILKAYYRYDDFMLRGIERTCYNNCYTLTVLKRFVLITFTIANYTQTVLITRTLFNCIGIAELLQAKNRLKWKLPRMFSKKLTVPVFHIAKCDEERTTRKNSSLFFFYRFKACLRVRIEYKKTFGITTCSERA